MSDFRKIRVVMNATYRNGDVLKNNHPTPARTEIVDIPGMEGKYKELSIRLAISAKEAEELLEGLSSGEVSLDIKDMLYSMERETNTRSRLMPTTIIESSEEKK